MKYITQIEQYLGKSIMDNYQFISQWRDYDVIIYEWKVYRFPKVGKEFDLHQEKRILDIMRPYVSLPIPQFTVVNNNFVVYPCIEWKTLDDCEVTYSDNFVNTLVWFIKELHSIPVDIFDFLQWDDQSPDKFQAWVQSLKDDVSTRLGWKVPDETIAKLHDYIQQLFIEYRSPVKAFTHSDLQWKNIIYNQKDQKIAWIIDFTGGRIWWVELDFCRFVNKDGGKLIERMVIAYLWYLDHWFIERARFLAKRTIIREIKNDDLYQNNFSLILDQLKKYQFI